MNYPEIDFLYLNEEDTPMYSEAVTNQLNNEIQKLMKMAWDRASTIIKSHQKLLEAIVAELLVNPILNAKKLSEIGNRVSED